MLRALVPEIVLIDSNGALAHAEAADIADANVLARPARVWAGDYADAARARIAVITAGGATHGSQDRLSVAADSAAIVTDCVDRLIGAGFSGVLVVAANPVDLMTLVALRRSGLPASQVIGTGTLLDTSRLKQALSQALGVAPTAIEGYVLGEHGDSEVAAFSTVRIGGLISTPSGARSGTPATPSSRARATHPSASPRPSWASVRPSIETSTQPGPSFPAPLRVGNPQRHGGDFTQGDVRISPSAPFGFP